MKKQISQGTKIIAVIKADGYGHGAAMIAKLIHDYEYIWGFAVATAEEALSLRGSGVTKPILILGLVFEEYFMELIKEDIRMTVCDLNTARMLDEEAKRQGRTVHIHLAVDTGMSRIGYADDLHSVEEIREISKLPNLEIEGLFTHFARADEYDRSPAVKQLQRYLHFWKCWRGRGSIFPCATAQTVQGSSGAGSKFKCRSCGITIYGIYPSDQVERDVIRLRPAMELKSCVTYVKDLDQEERSVMEGLT